MFSRKKETLAKKPRSSGGLAQYGLMDIPNIGNFDNMNDLNGEHDDDDDDDADLEAELLALTSGSAPIRQKPKPKAVPLAPTQLDKLVAESLRDVPSDESAGEDDDDDPELLEELGGLIGSEEADKPVERIPETKPEVHSTQPVQSLIAERLTMYQQAEANAKTAGDSSRARRLGRGIKTLSDLLKQAKAGRPINEADIPPPVVVQMTARKAPAQDEPGVDPSVPEGQPPLPDNDPQPSTPPAITPPSVPARRAPPPPFPQSNDTPPPVPPRRSAPPPISPTSNEQPSDSSQTPVEEMDTQNLPSSDSDTQALESEKSNTIKMLTDRRNAYKEAALKIKKTGDVDAAVKYLKVAKQFDVVIQALEEGKTVDLSEMPPFPPPIEQNPQQEQTSHIPVVSPKQEDEKQHSADLPVSVQPQEEQSETAEEYSVTYSSVGEALEARLKLYQTQEAAAVEAGNSRKSRQMGRIVKQYKDAIKMHSAGKPIPVDELPNPPGYAPIPVKGTAPSVVKQAPNVPNVPSAPTSQPAPVPSSSPKSIPTVTDDESKEEEAAQKQNVRKKAGSRVERQLSLLTLRQNEFKTAALEAKKKGEINQAKEYLRLAKGFDRLIDAANSGLPVDMDTLPLPPSAKEALETEFDVVTVEECLPNSDTEIYVKLENDLLNQLKMCMQTRNHFKAIGDVASANRFEQLALHTKKDLDVIKVANKKNDPVPRFHYETKTFSIVQCNTDLTDNDLQLSIVQGVNYCVPNPKEVDTYVRFEFPFPSENPPKDKTVIIYNTNNPIYNAVFPLVIQRNRVCQRVFKRQSIKCEVWSKGGFFRGDTLLGTAQVKLQPLETKCTIHDSFDLMEGRKTVGGKLEVKVRIRNPLLTKQVEQVSEKWLVIDN